MTPANSTLSETISQPNMTTGRLRVLLVPDSLYWITGTMAKEIVDFSPWIDGQIVSSVVLEHLFAQQVEKIAEHFDLVHILCQYTSRQWLPRLLPHLPVVTSHYHVANWETDRHNMDGDAVMAIAQEWVTDLEQRGEDTSKVLIHSTGVDTQFFLPPTASERQEVRKQLGIPPQNVAIGFFAKRSSNNRDDRKGTAVFSQAIQEFVQQVPQTSVVIVGPGWHDFVKQLRSQGIHCIWMKFLKTRAEVARTYRGLDFYWVTSRIEGGPVPLLEAMSTEVCCLTTPVGLVPEIGRHGDNMMIVPVGDAAGFVRETVKLTRDPEARRRLALAGRQTVVQEKDVRKTTADISQLYNLAMDNYASRRGLSRSSLPNCVHLASQIERTAIPSPRLISSPATAISLEKSFWGYSLCEQGQYANGLNWIVSAIANDPACIKAWKIGLQCSLPPALTGMLVKLKRFFSRRSDYR